MFVPVLATHLTVYDATSRVMHAAAATDHRLREQLHRWDLPVLHRITIGANHKAVCGRGELPFFCMSDDESRGVIAEWPPYIRVATIDGDAHRCRTCQNVTGNRPPAWIWKNHGQAVA